MTQVCIIRHVVHHVCLWPFLLFIMNRNELSELSYFACFHFHPNKNRLMHMKEYHEYVKRYQYEEIFDQEIVCPCKLKNIFICKGG